MKKLMNKTAVVTGAGSGIGKAIAELFAREGANVVVADLHPEHIDLVVKAITASGGKALGVVFDVSSETDVARLVEMTLKNFKTLDILVNNAGVMDDFMPVEKISDELWNKVMGVNLNGTFYTCRLAVPIMLNQSSGVIINIASVGGLFGTRAGAAYTASKHAVIGLTKNIGFMYAKNGIRCNAIAPGGVNTNIGANMKPDSFGMERGMLGMATMPRMGEPEEIANAALFLASADASFVNAAVLTVDGGWTAS